MLDLPCLLWFGDLWLYHCNNYCFVSSAYYGPRDESWVIIRHLMKLKAHIKMPLIPIKCLSQGTNYTATRCIFRFFHGVLLADSAIDFICVRELMVCFLMVLMDKFFYPQISDFCWQLVTLNICHHEQTLGQS